MSYAKRWVFTLNNYTDAEIAHISHNVDEYEYLVYGKEVGATGTPHLQGFVVFKQRKRLTQLKLLLGNRCHFELARGSNPQASTYCKKDGDYTEYGDPDVAGQAGNGSGKRTDFDRLREWIAEQDSAPTHFEVASLFPSLWGRYRNACIDFIQLFSVKPQLVAGELREWQQELNQLVDTEPNDRTVEFIIDIEGNKGKSWLTRFWFSYRTDIQRLSVGKRDDLAYAVDTSKRIFIFDIPRGQLEYMQYSILEQIKDQMIFSPKYESSAKVIPHLCHVIVFTNEEPDVTKMTIDRFNLKYL